MEIKIFRPCPPQQGQPLQPLSLRLAARFHQALLAIYPAQFQSGYGDEMQAFFEARCTEVYERTGNRIVQWLLLSLVDGVSSAYQEHVDSMTEKFRTQRETRHTFILGMFFLAGTWAAMFFLSNSLLSPRQMPAIVLISAVWVLLNAVLTARALDRSEQYENVPGMAAMVNIILIASLMAMAGAGLRLQLEPAIRLLLQGLVGLLVPGLVGVHAWLLWQLRGDTLTENRHEGVCDG